MIADSAEGFRDQLEKSLNQKHKTICASNGTQVWEIFRQFQPDILVIDLELPEMDGMTLLRRIYAGGFRPAVIVIARLLSDYAVDTLIQMKVSYILRKPCKPQIVAEQVDSLLAYESLEVSPVRTKIANLLREFSIPDHLDGNKYLISATIQIMQNPSQYITKELYPSVGKEYGLDGGRVERCIRHAIEIGWQNGGRSVWEQYFNVKPEVSLKKPKNADFIRAMVEMLKSSLQ